MLVATGSTSTVLGSSGSYGGSNKTIVAAAGVADSATEEFDRNVDRLVQHILERHPSMMESDKRIRAMKQKIGFRLRGGGVLTTEVLDAARTRCQAYWAEVTPGNVALVVNSIADKCSRWEDAEPKFRWLWTNGDWQPGRRSLQLAGRILSREDLQEAERRSRQKFVAAVPSKAPTGAPSTDPLPPSMLVPPPPPPASPQGAAGAAPPLHALNQPSTTISVDSSDVNELSRPLSALIHRARRGERPAKPAAQTTEAVGAVAPKLKIKDVRDNVAFIVDHILQKCSSMDSASTFFQRMRSHGNLHVSGRTLTVEEVAEAERRCKEVFFCGGGGKSVGSSATANITTAARAVPSTAERAAPPPGHEQTRPVVPVCERDDKYSVFAVVQPKAPRRTRRPPAGSGIKATTSVSAPPYDEGNVAMIVNVMLRRCNDMTKADAFFQMLHRSTGKMNPLGRVFSEEDVEEARSRCEETWKKRSRAGKNSKHPQSESDWSESESTSSSSSTSSRRAQKRRKRNVDAKKRRKKCAKSNRHASKASLGPGFLEEELEGIMFGGGSDSEALSGEEQLDVEEGSRLVTSELLAGIGAGDSQEVEERGDDGYPVNLWEEIAPETPPGHLGFNARATAVMRRASVGASRLQVELDVDAACPPLQPHQESVSFLLHPKSPVSRLLVDHPTGSGKTREMIKVLDNYFYDRRPKVPIFPKDPVCRNFYTELMRWPSRYRDYFCCERPADAASASGQADWRPRRFHFWDFGRLPEMEVRRLCSSIQDVLEMKHMFYLGQPIRSYRTAFRRQHPGEPIPLSPLRALGYTSAGGAFSVIDAKGRPASALMKIGYERGSGNVYTNKVVLMDEAHNLVRAQTQYGQQLHRLRELLLSARNMVLAGFTGTPILSEPTEGRHLLDIVKGIHAPEGDEGFLSSFPMRPQPLFPMSLPRGVPDKVLTLQRKRQLVRRVELHGEALKVYDWKRREGLPVRRLRAYCNASVFHGSFHDGKHGTKVKVLSFPEDCCPKLLAIARAVASSPEKAIVMTSRMNGYVVMLELMRLLAFQSSPPFRVATMEELSEFNHVSNIRGDVYRVLVADAAQCSEGVSFLAVRRTFLSDVAVSPSSFIQQCGRSIRMYGHRGLPEEEQTVTNQLYVATLPKWMRSSALACWSLRAQKRNANGVDLEKRARLLTARLRRAGIRTLSELKERITTFRAQLDVPGEFRRAGLTSEDVALFLEGIGLLEEAHLLRCDDRKDSGDLRSEAEEPFLAAASQMNSLPPIADGHPDGADARGVEGVRGGGAVVPVTAEVASPASAFAIVTAGTMPQSSIALGDAISLLRLVCDEMAGPGAGSAWRTKLAGGLGPELRRDASVALALKSVVAPKFDVMNGDLTTLTTDQVRLFRDEMVRLDRVASLGRALSVLGGVRDEAETQIVPMKETQPAPMDVQGSPTEAWRARLVAALRQLRLCKYVGPLLGFGPGRECDALLESWTPERVAKLHDELSKLRAHESLPAPKPRALARAMQALYSAETADGPGLSLSLETADEESLRQLIERTQEFAPALADMRSLAVDREIFKHLADVDEGDVGDEDLSESDLASELEKDLFGKDEVTPVVLPADWRFEWVRRGKRSSREFIDPRGRRYRNVREVRSALAALGPKPPCGLTGAHSAKALPIQDVPRPLDLLPIRMRLRRKASVDSMPLLGMGSTSGPHRLLLKRVRPSAETPHELGTGTSVSRASNSTSRKVATQGTAGQHIVRDGAADSAADVSRQSRQGVLEQAFEEALDASLANVEPGCSEARGTDPSENRGPEHTLLPETIMELHSLVAKPELNGQTVRLVRWLAKTRRWQCMLLRDGQKVVVKPVNLGVPRAMADDRFCDANAQPRDNAPLEVGAGSSNSSACMATNASVAAKISAGRCVVGGGENFGTTDSGQPRAGLLEQAFEEALDDALSNMEPGPGGLGISGDVIRDIPLASGADVTLHGLTANPELNGREARLLRWIEEMGRWECQLTKDGQRIKVKPPHLAATRARTPFLDTALAAASTATDGSLHTISRGAVSDSCTAPSFEDCCASTALGSAATAAAATPTKRPSPAEAADNTPPPLLGVRLEGGEVGGGARRRVRLKGKQAAAPAAEVEHCG